MKHLKFIFLSYTFLNICSVFASEDPINTNDGNDSKNSALISEVKMDKENMQNSSEIISRNENDESDQNDLFPANYSMIKFLKDVFYSKKQVSDDEMGKIANEFYNNYKSDEDSYDIIIEFDITVSEYLIPSIVMPLDRKNSYRDVYLDACCVMDCTSGSVTTTDENGRETVVRCPSDLKHLANLNKKGSKFYENFNNLLGVISRIRTLLSKYPDYYEVSRRTSLEDDEEDIRNHARTGNRRNNDEYKRRRSFDSSSSDSSYEYRRSCNSYVYHDDSYKD